MLSFSFAKTNVQAKTFDEYGDQIVEGQWLEVKSSSRRARGSGEVN